MGRGFDSQQGVRDVVSSPKRPDRLCCPPYLLFNGKRGYLFSEVKRSGCEFDYSLSSNTEVKNDYSYNTAPITGVLISP